MDPSGPSQPTQQSGFNQSGNPSSKTTAEEVKSQDKSASTAPPIDRRTAHDVPSTHDSEAQATSLGQGDTGPLKQRDISESDAENYSKSELDGEQMRAPGEGEVAAAVTSSEGQGYAEEPSLAQDMDAKTEAHKKALHERGQRTEEEIEKEGQEDWTGKKGTVDLGEALGGRGTGVVLAADE